MIGRTRAAAALACVLLASLLSTAAAMCVQLPGGSELTIEDVGRVLFRELATDRVRDLVTFGGGVCLELGGLEVWIEAESLVVRSPTTDARIEAEGAVVHAGPWRLVAGSLLLGVDHGVLREVTLEGAGVVGRARELALDASLMEMRAEDLEVVTPTVRLSAERGTIDAQDVLRVEHASATTCDCPARTAPIRVEARAAVLELRLGRLGIEGGLLVVEGMRIPLPSTLTVTEHDLATIDVPFTVGVVAEGRRGWVLGLVEREDQGVTVGGDLAFGAEADPRWRVRLSAAEDGASVTASARDGGLAIVLARRAPLGGALELVLGHRLEAGAIRNRVHDASVAVVYRQLVRPGAAIASLELQASAALALTAQHVGGVDVVHPRTRLAGTVLAATPAGRAGTLSARFEVGLSAYAGHAARQAWFGVVPRWRASFGPLAIDASHTIRMVSGSSPFDDRVDRLPHAALSELRMTLSVPVGGEVALGSSLDLRYDWRPDPLRPGGRIGLQRLRADLNVSGGAAVGGTPPGAAAAGGVLGWQVGLSFEGAGLLDPRAERDAFLRGSVALTGIAGRSEASVAAELGVGPERPGMRSLTLAGATPLAFGGGSVELVPYLALDVWPVIAGEGLPRIPGHGLELRWDTCCGTLDLGYRALPDGSLTTRLAFAVVPRVPSLEQLGD